MDTGTLATVITGDMVKGVLNEVINLIPVVLPAALTFLGIRKGISFVMGILHSA